MITGKTVWITGASSGIGRAMAEKLLAAGNHVIASSRNVASLESLVVNSGGRLSLLACDVGNRDSMQVAARRLAELTDYLDWVILNAGTCEYLDLPTVDPAMFERVFATNVQGAVNCLALALPLLRKYPNSGARIVAVSSLSSLLPFPRAEAYGASKAALEYTMAALRIDLRPFKIGVTVVQPGFVATPLTEKNDFPMPGLISPERAAEEILWAAHKGKDLYRFPKRLSVPLLLLRAMGGIWSRLIAPALSRNQSGLY